MYNPFDHNRPTPFSGEETERIRAAIREDAPALQCPRCGGSLTSDTPRSGRCSHIEVWELHCEACCSYLLVEDTL